jgi:hypothetical protein
LGTRIGKREHQLWKDGWASEDERFDSILPRGRFFASQRIDQASDALPRHLPINGSDSEWNHAEEKRSDACASDEAVYSRLDFGARHQTV